MAKQWEGEVVPGWKVMRVAKSKTHLTLPTLRAGPLPLPRCAGEEGL